MGKKGGTSSKAKSAHEEAPSENEGVKLTGVLSVDLAALCEYQHLPPIYVRPLHPKALAETSSGELVEGEVPSSRLTVLADWEDSADPSTPLHTLHMRGWLLSDKVLSILTEALSNNTQLNVLNLWNVGLTASTLQTVTALAAQWNVSELYLDGNALFPEPLVELLKTKTSVELLSLKCCHLTDQFLIHLTPSLTENRTLLHFDLSCNHITDAGVSSLATALRLNRTLLSLTLTDNRVGDTGVAALAEVLCEFPLNHDEVVMKRKLDSSQGKTDDGQCDGGLEVSTGRTASVASVDKRGGGKTFSGKGKKDSKKDDKGKKDEKGKKGESRKGTRDKETKGSKKGGEVVEEVVESDSSESKSPLLEATKSGDQWLLPGNSSLVFLGLSYNSISEVGALSLLSVVQYQSRAFTSSPSSPGLLSLSLTHNSLSLSSPVLCELEECLTLRDPLRPAEQEPSDPVATDNTDTTLMT